MLTQTPSRRGPLLGANHDNPVLNAGDLDRANLMWSEAEFAAALRASVDTKSAIAHLRLASNLMDPSAMRRLADYVIAAGDRFDIDHLKTKVARWGRLRQIAPNPYKMTSFGKFATLYQSDGPAEGKRLIICFTGLARAIFMPIWDFLQLLPKGAADVLVLSRGDVGDYSGGIEGLGQSLEEVCTWIKTQFADQPYAGTSYCGTSIGGFFALRAAVLTEAKMGVSVSGRFHQVGGQIPLSGAGNGHDVMCHCRDWPATELRVYYGEENRVDARSAEQLHAINPKVELRPLKGSSHNGMVLLNANRMLKPFFASLSGQ